MTLPKRVTKIRTYRTDGDVRGTCGHKHRSLRTAAKCIHADRVACEGMSGYSDRRVVRANGESVTESEYYAAESFLAEFEGRP